MCRPSIRAISDRPISGAKEVDAFIIRTIDSALRALRRQIELELALDKEWKGDNRIDTPSRAGDIVKAFAASLPSVRALLDTDVKAAFEGDPSAKSIDEIIFCFPGFAAIVRHRLAHQLYSLGATMIARIIAEHAHSETGIDIHPGAQIGEGFFIDHGTGVVIGETAVIGRNVRLYQAVTLGAKRFEADGAGGLREELPTPSHRRGRRRDLRRGDDPRAGRHRQGVIDRRQRLAHARRPARKQHHAGQGAQRIVRRRRWNMNTIRRSALQDIWNATRVGFARLNRVLADAGDESDLVFHVRKNKDPLRPKACGSARPSDGSRDRDPERTLG